MMLVIEYANVLSKGLWQDRVANRKIAQYLLAVLLGATPGCLGAFAVVAMYSHRVVSLGALVAAMIATSGDEAFVMFALFPETALMLTGILIVLGVLGGWLTDVLVSKRVVAKYKMCDKIEIHNLDVCECFPRGRILKQWRELSLARGVLMSALFLFAFGLASGSVGSPQWDWKRVTLMAVTLVGIFIVSTVPEHFLQEHLWEHVARRHVHRVFLWTFGALLVTHLLSTQICLDEVVRENQLLVTAIAALVGVIPESGPHLLFTTLFAKGVVPFGVLLTSSIVQDGHGMLPLLAHSRKEFVMVKMINLIVGGIVGSLVYLAVRL
ncbi:MAG: arsenic efflux protein, partial [candidate division Zixibacteria bacterium]|nr:arsenic efflux protein [candidate division Zixibacteria bacterium]